MINKFRVAYYRSTPPTHLGVQAIGNANFNKTVVYASLVTEFLNIYGDALKQTPDVTKLCQAYFAITDKNLAPALGADKHPYRIANKQYTEYISPVYQYMTGEKAPEYKLEFFTGNAIAHNVRRNRVASQT